MTNLPVIGDRRRLIVLIAAVVVIVGLLSWFLLSPPATTLAEPAPVSTRAAPSTVAPPSPSPSPSPSASPTVVASIVASTSAPPPPPPSPSPSPTGLCEPPSAEGFVPVRYEIERFGSDEKVVSLGLDKEGSIAAPPLDEPRIASWWNQGPRAGSEAGKVVLSIHTYRRGGAMGNTLFDGGKSALQPGDRIILRGAAGEVACYDFVEAKKVAVVDYDPASNDMVDYDGKPLLTIIVCWDYVKGSKAWDSRVFFYSKQVVGD
ncbi:class F sortase [Tessaracoccus antarcticus]|uniref:Class F sortase n=1 Tax=Tessaracoccus antarcticus TaxID=2479848 RepID=A0A3M0G4C5_9ACTN|nr:class F sortase [Tessaracoccus antarcticus]RMB59705.1 class F sortase [Tessaracoccus antarcticus]